MRLNFTSSRSKRYRSCESPCAPRVATLGSRVVAKSHPDKSLHRACAAAFQLDLYRRLYAMAIRFWPSAGRPFSPFQLKYASLRTKSAVH